MVASDPKSILEEIRIDPDGTNPDIAFINGYTGAYVLTAWRKSSATAGETCYQALKQANGHEAVIGRHVVNMIRLGLGRSNTRRHPEEWAASVRRR
jgi:hypothetical protein